MKSLRPGLLGLTLFAVALALRVPGLGGFLTPDETVWSAGAAQCVLAASTGDWAATNISGHPGVTTLWAGSLGLVARWLLARPADMPTLADAAHALAANPVRLDFLPWLRLPVALACSLGVALVYLLARRLIGEPAALLGAALLSFDPFMLAHSRVLQMDALLATHITVAWLALLVAVRTRQRRYFLCSGVAIGLAVLTKSPGLVMGPLMLAWVLGAWLTGRADGRGQRADGRGQRADGRGQRADGRDWRAAARGALADLFWLGAPALITGFLLWPSLWVAPAATIGRMWGLMTFYGAGAHELGNFWLGQPAAEPGRAFYLVTLLWRLTPLTVAGLLLALLAARRQAPAARRAAGSLLAAALWFGLIISLGDKKFDRYLLPVFPALDLLAGWGWAAGAGWAALAARRGPAARARYATALIALVAVGGQAGVALANRPTYFTAYNPLMGGIRTAQQTFLVGWGEGLAEAAAYLNTQPPAGGGRVAAWYGQNVFGAFYHGQSYDLYYDTRTAADLYAHDVDYVVTYVNQMQRGLLDASVQAQLAAPLYTHTAGGVTLAQVYAWPKPFDHSADRPVSAGLRLLGWDLPPYDPATRQATLTLYWDAETLAAAPGAAQGLAAWIKDAGGEVWAKATAETAPRPATAWLARPAQAQTFTLRTPAGLAAGEYRLEIAPPGGEALGLAHVAVPATQVGGVIAADGALPDAERVPAPVDFGGAAALIGYKLQRDPGELVVDLLWASPSAATTLAHGEGRVSVQMRDAQERIAAQAEIRLPAWPDSAAVGTAARQRVHLTLPPAWEGKPYRLFVGVYRPADGAWLAPTATGAAIDDSRYLLAAIQGW